MRKALRGLLLAGVLSPLPAIAQDSLSFSTSVDLNYKKLLLTSVFVNTTTRVANENEFRPSLWMLNISPSLAYKGLFLTGGFERSLGDGSTSGATSNGWQERHYSREENSVTAGYNVWAGLSFFAGYLNNLTTINTSQSNGIFSSTKLREKGPYYGVAYAHRFAGGGTVGASFAVARAHGESVIDNSSNSGTTGTGTVRGNSFGLSWTAPLIGSMYYRLGYKGTRYDFAFVDNFGFDRRTKQNYDAYYLGIANYF